MALLSGTHLLPCHGLSAAQRPVALRYLASRSEGGLTSTHATRRYSLTKAQRSLAKLSACAIKLSCLLSKERAKLLLSA